MLYSTPEVLVNVLVGMFMGATSVLVVMRIPPKVFFAGRGEEFELARMRRSYREMTPQYRRKFRKAFDLWDESDRVFPNRDEEVVVPEREGFWSEA